MKKPNLFIVGEPKSGTTSLYYYLKNHPDVGMSSYKEPKFFATDLMKESDKFHGKESYFPIRALDDYLDLFKGQEDKKILGDASPHYAFSKSAAKNIHEYNPEAKIVILFREPVDFLFSLYCELRANLNEDSVDFETALVLEKERRVGKHVPGTVMAPSYLYYSEWVKYTEHIKRFYKYFDENQIHVIIFDDFKNNATGTYKRLLRFLGLKPDSNFRSKIYNYSHQIRFQPVMKVFMSPTMTNIVKKVVPKKHIGKASLLFRRIVFKKSQRSVLDEKLRKKLMKKYKKEVVKLSEFLKRDLLSEWGYNSRFC